MKTIESSRMMIPQKSFREFCQMFPSSVGRLQLFNSEGLEITTFSVHAAYLIWRSFQIPRLAKEDYLNG